MDVAISAEMRDELRRVIVGKSKDSPDVVRALQRYSRCACQSRQTQKVHLCRDSNDDLSLSARSKHGPSSGMIALLDPNCCAKNAKGLQNSSINRYLSSLRRAFTLGMEALPPPVHSCPKIKKLTEDNVREGFLEHEQYVALRNELPDHQKTLLVIGYHFGMRKGEILKLRWDQVDWDAKLIRLEKKQTKAKQARNAPLYGEVVAWLDMVYATRDPECPYIVAWQGQSITETKTAWEESSSGGWHSRNPNARSA